MAWQYYQNFYFCQIMLSMFLVGILLLIQNSQVIQLLQLLLRFASMVLLIGFTVILEWNKTMQYYTYMHQNILHPLQSSLTHIHNLAQSRNWRLIDKSSLNWCKMEGLYNYQQATLATTALRIELLASCCYFGVIYQKHC